MLKLRTLDLKVQSLRTSCFQLGLRLGDIYGGRNAASVAVLRQLECFFKGGDIGVKELLFRVETAHLKIIDSQFGVQTQTD